MRTDKLNIDKVYEELVLQNTDLRIYKFYTSGVLFLFVSCHLDVVKATREYALG